MSDINRQFMLARIPSGPLTQDCFRLERGAIPMPGDGEVLVKARYVSLDAANRAWMQGATYRDAIEAGTVMAGGVLGEVVQSRHGDFAPGDLVSGDCGWQDYAARPGKVLRKVTPTDPLSHLLSIYGITGLTAYFGLIEVGRPKAGETVVVSAAAGAVGNVVGQIAKVLGCRVVGIAGSDDKCRWLTDELGFDEAVNYKSGPLYKTLKAACPGGIDVYFDNVGGDVFETVLFQMNLLGRIACCGAVSAYDGTPPAHGPRGVPGLFVVKRLTVRGFIVSDFFEQRDEALEQLRAWVADGRLKVIEDVISGFEALPEALIGLLNGENRGKRMVKIC
ncbi:NADP-dependent oxidoreductase [Iodidimonas sp. SYSU 1G8]|uniref:NADP-dependent oxidoreductase n=1 Tax=Iodidimonas sp. SYSU 1G8 TaxID=3133967 RepID=UPI0031FE90DB